MKKSLVGFLFVRHMMTEDVCPFWASECYHTLVQTRFGAWWQKNCPRACLAYKLRYFHYGFWPEFFFCIYRWRWVTQWFIPLVAQTWMGSYFMDARVVRNGKHWNALWTGQVYDIESPIEGCEFCEK